VAVVVTAAGMIMLLTAPFGSERLFTVFQFRGLCQVSYSKPRLTSVPRLTVCNLSMYPKCPFYEVHGRESCNNSQHIDQGICPMISDDHH
jgi:hypothetical protein